MRRGANRTGRFLPHTPAPPDRSTRSAPQQERIDLPHRPQPATTHARGPQYSSTRFSILIHEVQKLVNEYQKLSHEYRKLSREYQRLSREYAHTLPRVSETRQRVSETRQRGSETLPRVCIDSSTRFRDSSTSIGNSPTSPRYSRMSIRTSPTSIRTSHWIDRPHPNSPSVRSPNLCPPGDSRLRQSPVCFTPPSTLRPTIAT